MEKATFGAGCFWGVEEAFRTLNGVKKTEVGFMGGWLKKPSYMITTTGLTGHAEVVQISYDPKKISYKKLLEIFWSIHDPTTKNRQGLNIGPQYRSVIFFHNKKQENTAKKYKKELEDSGKFKKKIVTQIQPAGEFWRAEEYHQKYLQKKGLKTC